MNSLCQIAWACYIISLQYCSRVNGAQSNGARAQDGALLGPTSKHASCLNPVRAVDLSLILAL